MSILEDQLRAIPRELLEELGIMPIPQLPGDRGPLQVICTWHPDDLGRHAAAIAALREYVGSVAMSFSMPGPDAVGFHRKLLEIRYGESKRAPTTGSVGRDCNVCGAQSRLIVSPKGAGICAECLSSLNNVIGRKGCDFCDHPSGSRFGAGALVICEGCVELAREIDRQRG